MPAHAVPTTRTAESRRADDRPRGSGRLALTHHPLGEFVDVFVRREDAERFIEDVRGDEPELGKDLRIEERELETGTVN